MLVFFALSESFNPISHTKKKWSIINLFNAGQNDEKKLRKYKHLEFYLILTLWSKILTLLKAVEWRSKKISKTRNLHRIKRENNKKEVVKQEEKSSRPMNFKRLIQVKYVVVSIDHYKTAIYTLCIKNCLII